MRSIAFALALLMVSSFALGDDPPKIDLDRPAVLDPLKQQHPQRYQAVQAVWRAVIRNPMQR